MSKFKGCFTTFLIAFFVLAIGIAVATVFFVKDNSSFNYKDLLNLDNKNKSTLQQKVEDQVTQRVVVLEENAVIDVIKNSSPAIVSIVAEQVGIDPFSGPFQEQSGIGTGFIVEGGYVFTNKHVVDANIDYSVVLNDGETSYKVSQINKDPLNDFAILKIDSGGATLPSLTLGSSANLQVGQTVVAIGNALGEFSNTASKGIISGIGRSIQAGGIGQSEYLDNVIQTDAALNPGNSGGPLLDLEGKVIGINVARASGENIGFTLPIDSVKSVYSRFKEVGEIQRPYMGIRYTLNTSEASKLNRVPVGAVITDVLPGTPASKAGLEKYDVITKVDGQDVNAKNTLARIVAEKKVNDNIELTVDRGGKSLTIGVKLEAAK